MSAAMSGDACANRVGVVGAQPPTVWPIALKGTMSIPLYKTANWSGGDGMSSTVQEVSGQRASLQELAQRHLWMHFTRLGATEVPIIARGEGCYVYDDHGNRYLDGLSALFCVNIGHGRADIAQAGVDQAKELGFFTNWSYAHPPAIELADADRGARPGRPQPRVLHEWRQRGGRIRAEARPAVPQAPGPRAQAQGDRAGNRVPRHVPRARCRLPV